MLNMVHSQAEFQWLIFWKRKTSKKSTVESQYLESFNFKFHKKVSKQESCNRVSKAPVVHWTVVRCDRVLYINSYPLTALHLSTSTDKLFFRLWLDIDMPKHYSSNKKRISPQFFTMRNLNGSKLKYLFWEYGCLPINTVSFKFIF